MFQWTKQLIREILGTPSTVTEKPGMIEGVDYQIVYTADSFEVELLTGPDKGHKFKIMGHALDDENRVDNSAEPVEERVIRQESHTIPEE